MKDEPVDIRDVLLKMAGKAFIDKTVTFDGDPCAYTGEAAVKVGLDIVDLVERFDREFSYKKINKEFYYRGDIYKKSKEFI